VQVTTRTKYGRTHQLEFKNALTDLQWSPAATLLGDGSVQTLRDAAPSFSNQRFYRLRVE